MERWYKVGLVALTAVWLVMPPPGRADPAGGDGEIGVGKAGIDKAGIDGPRQLVPPGDVVRAEVPFGSGVSARAAPVTAVERDPALEVMVAGGPEDVPVFDPEVPVQAAVVSTVPEPPHAYLPPAEAEDESGPEAGSPAVEAATFAPAGFRSPAPPLPDAVPASWPRPPAPPIAGLVPNPAPPEAVHLPRPPTPPESRRPQAGAAPSVNPGPVVRVAPVAAEPPPPPGAQKASLDARLDPDPAPDAGPGKPRAVVSLPVTRLMPPRATVQRTVLTKPVPPADDGAVFVVAPRDRLSPNQFPRYTACVSGENVILGRTIFANSMIVPESNRAAAIKVGLCDVILVTRVSDAEYARRQLTFVGLPADIHRK